MAVFTVVKILTKHLDLCRKKRYNKNYKYVCVYNRLRQAFGGRKHKKKKFLLKHTPFGDANFVGFMF